MRRQSRSAHVFDMMCSDVASGGSLWVVSRVAAALPPYSANRLRTALFRLVGVGIGQGSVIAGRLLVAGGERPQHNLMIGARCFVNDGVRFDTLAPIAIGNDVDLGHDVRIITSTHDIGEVHRRAGRLRAAAVTIGDGCWVGAGAVILPGVTIGDGAIIAAGAVVTRAVPSNSLVGGVPAESIRTLKPLDAPAGSRSSDPSRQRNRKRSSHVTSTLHRS